MGTELSPSKATECVEFCLIPEYDGQSKVGSPWSVVTDNASCNVYSFPIDVQTRKCSWICCEDCSYITRLSFSSDVSTLKMEKAKRSSTLLQGSLSGRWMCEAKFIWLVLFPLASLPSVRKLPFFPLVKLLFISLEPQARAFRMYNIREQS